MLLFGFCLFVLILLISNKQWGTRRQPSRDTCNMSEAAHQWVGFLLMFYTSASLAHQKTIKNACTTPGAFLLKVQNAESLSKQCTLFPLDWWEAGCFFPMGLVYVLPPKFKRNKRKPEEQHFRVISVETVFKFFFYCVNTDFLFCVASERKRACSFSVAIRK